MEKCLIHIVPIIFYLCSFLSASAQTFNQYVKNGDREFTTGDYYEAAVYYGKALELNDHRIDVNYKFAQSSRLFNDYVSANKAYASVTADDNYLNFPLAEYWMAVTFKYMGDYDKAINHFTRFVSRYRKKDLILMTAQHELEVLPLAKQLLKDTVDVIVEHLGSEINSPFSEFAATEIKDSLLQFSSIREEQDGGTDGQKFLSRIYAFFNENGKWKEDKNFIAPLNDSDKHIANGSFSPDRKSFYFTVCENINFSELHCGIYVTSYIKGKWQQPISLNINLPCCTSTQPTLGRDQNGKEVLFFASDREGSVGKLDIWKSEKMDNGQFKTPVNLGSNVNSIEDEVTPYFDSRTGVLYFSSKWHTGLGGYDIFKTTLKDDHWSTPENMGYPLNSSYNDLYFNMDEVGKNGYLTSNRLGSFFIKGETCCNDIYRFELPTDQPDTMEIATSDTFPINADTAAFIADTSVEIMTLKTDTIKKIIGKTEKIPEVSKSDELIKKMQDLLPITLYFHNDEPDCCTMADTTRLNYKATYQEYTSMLYQYISEYSLGKSDSEKDSARIRIKALFDNYVDKGMIDLIRFTNILNEALKVEKRDIQVTLRGYCSPLAVNPYNINLAKRRIASLRNYFFNYKNGMFNPYLDRGQLVFVHEPIGEEQAAKNVSDNPGDVQNSIYNPAAALERRVYIVAVDVK